MIGAGVPMRLKTAVLVLLGAFACGGREPGPPLGNLASGQLSIAPTPAYSGACEFPETRTLIKTEAEWQQTWSALYACVEPAPSLPTVDFTHEMLVVAGVGARSSGGHLVAITAASVDSTGVLRVRLTEYRPGRTCVTTQSFTWPVAVARVERSDAEVTFDSTVDVVNCD
jgi:hypothetical protein